MGKKMEKGGESTRKGGTEVIDELKRKQFVGSLKYWGVVAFVAVVVGGSLWALYTSQ